jgi:hypothetical protein
MPANGLDQFRLRARAESFDWQENHGGTAISGECEVSMKVVIQSYTDTILVWSGFQNIGVVGPDWVSGHLVVLVFALPP